MEQIVKVITETGGWHLQQKGKLVQEHTVCFSHQFSLRVSSFNPCYP